ncbi:MAG: GHMP kinase [Chloroflexi bacterium]|nr:GHMP kinase [Chloroflexota bacterium]
MLIRAKAPLRISFGGGGTDVPPFTELEGGCVLSATIDRYAWGTLRPRHDGGLCIESRDFGTSLSYSSRRDMVLDGELDLAKAAIRRLTGDYDQGFDLYLHSDAPPGSGLGSSSAMMVAMVGLLKEWKGLPLTDYEVADTAHQIERHDLAIAGGMQDQYAATFGGVNFIEFGADRVVVNSLRLGRDILNELEYNLLLVDTGLVRLSSNIIEDQVARYERREHDSVDALRQIKSIALEMKDKLLHRKWDDFGHLLDEEWQQKKRMSDRISSPELDDLYRFARENGAIGGKITGAGGGGFLLLYCDFERKHALADLLRQRGCDPSEVALERDGLQTWRVG